MCSGTALKGHTVNLTSILFLTAFLSVSALAALAVRRNLGARQQTTEGAARVSKVVDWGAWRSADADRQAAVHQALYANGTV
jgi:hypothetical protein